MLIKKIKIEFLVIAGACLFFMGSAWANITASKTPEAAATPAPAVIANKKLTNEEIKLKLMSHVPQVVIHSVKQSAIPNLYQVDSNFGTIYITHDGNYFVEGDLYTFTTNSIKNLTEAEMDKKRQEVLAKQNPKDMIIFSPPKDKIKATITVFTDIDCGYCRKLHSEINKINNLGIEVRYMAFPRAGIKSESYNKFVSAWCATNQQEALTTAKLGKPIPAKTCTNPVAKQYELGQSLGVSGTPAIILADGTLVPGYMPAEKLAQEIGILKAPNFVEKPAAR